MSFRLHSSWALVLGLLAACTDAPELAIASAATTGALTQAAPAHCLGAGCAGGLEDGEFEYVVVGAGAGGGPLAARLAQQGHRVLLLEAGGDAGDELTYQIPAWHALASENPRMRWDYFVSHYDDPAQAARDDKLQPAGPGQPDGIWYPRGTGLGGSTSLNAMVAVAPHASDWDHIADLLADEDPDGSWRSPQMRHYFERAERNGYLPPGTAGHGFSGWMPTSAHLDDMFDLLTSAVDFKMLRVIVATILEGSGAGGGRFFNPVRDLLQILAYVRSDVNAPDGGGEGVFRVPQQSEDGRRVGVRERVLDTIKAGYPLTLKTRALVTGVTFDRSGPVPRATGVEWLDGPDLYDASALSAANATGVARAIRVSREVILSAGALNTPQLLLLSGIGAPAQLAAHGIETVVELPGVGANLQDRYEVGVIGEMSSLLGDQFRLLKDCSFDPKASRAQLDASDPCYVLWKYGVGVYTINGSVVGVVKRSDPALADPDLFIFGLPGYFKGYWPGYSAETTSSRKHFTWVVLKAHTENDLGQVSLRSADPRERPEIRFQYFADGRGDADLDALVDGVLFARRMVERTRQLSPYTDDFREVYPGPEVDTRAEIRQFIRDKAWGHHACCTAKIGRADDPSAVLDGDFRVRGTVGLRVVDASVFPRIPGFFLAVPIYMIAEKAAEVIHQDALRD